MIDILTEPTPRQKLGNVNTIDDVVELLKRSRNIIVLTGAGVSSFVVIELIETLIYRLVLIQLEFFCYKLRLRFK